MTAAPAYATRPTPGARHELAAVAEVARLLRRPLMPWQSQVSRVATELHPDGVRWRWPIVIVTVPRQAGKTTLEHAISVQRSIRRRAGNLGPNQSWYTAQTGKDARARWRDLVRMIRASPELAPLATVRESIGSESITWSNLAEISPFAPTPNSLHGYTPPLVTTDEAFAHDEDAGTALEGAIRPAQVTIPDRQWWIVSTAGTATSTWLKRWIDLGRASIDDPASPIAYFEWSLAADLDPYDPANWGFHPALGHTITLETLAGEAASTPGGEWLRAYCNRWTSTSTPLLDLGLWDQLAAPDTVIPLPAGRVGLGYDVSADATSGAVWAAWLDHADRLVVHCVQAGPGIGWVAQAVIDARRALPGRPTPHAHTDGPVRGITDQLELQDIAVTLIRPADAPTGTGQLLRAARGRTLVHDGSPALRAALSVAATRPAPGGGGGWTLSPVASAGPIDALRAAAAAVRATTTTPTPIQPSIWVP